MMEFLDKCPNCGKNLELQQINLTIAVFICKDVNCPYPTNSECMVVERSIKDIHKQVDLCSYWRKEQARKKSNDMQDILDCLDDLLNTPLNTYGQDVDVKSDNESIKEEPPEVKNKSVKQEAQNLDYSDFNGLLDNWFNS